MVFGDDMLVNLQRNIEDVENTVCSRALCSFEVMYLSPDCWVCCIGSELFHL